MTSVPLEDSEYQQVLRTPGSPDGNQYEFPTEKREHSRSPSAHYSHESSAQKAFPDPYGLGSVNGGSKSSVGSRNQSPIPSNRQSPIPSDRQSPTPSNQELTEKVGGRSLSVSSTASEAPGDPLFRVFKNAETDKLLGLIDQLRDIGLSTDVDLPELVVTGNQSSGKSSLLESLTGLPFPSNAEACTRFTTKVSIRRSPVTRTKAFVISSTVKFHRDFSENPTPEEFKQLLKDVSVVLRVENSGFSKDILHIEASGPDRTPLSFMDTPGLFVSGSTTQTKEDADLVEGLVRNQIKSSRAIIVAVMAARDNVETQSVWSLADSVDPESVRTVGVLTKCDLLDRGGEENLALSTARNEKKLLRLGWFVVKNRSDTDVRENKPLAQSRKDEKILFNNPIWATLPRSNVGIDALKLRLERLLCDHIKQELPKMQNDVYKSLLEAEAALKKLGPARPTIDSQRQLLSKIADKYTKSMDNQLLDQHKDPDAYKFWNRIRTLREKFQLSMKDAHTHQLYKSKEKMPESSSVDKRQDWKYDKTDQIDGFSTWEWLSYRYHSFSGRELPGQFNPELLCRLFKELTQKWEEHAKYHIAMVQQELEACFHFCLERAASDERMHAQLKQHLGQDQDDIIEDLKNHVSRHIQNERSTILTTNPQYEQRIIEAKANRFAQVVEGIKVKITGKPPPVNEIFHHTSQLQDALCEPRWTIVELHDVLAVYYELTAQHFVDSVTKQVVDPFITGVGSPLSFFHREYVEKMSNEDVERVAAESPEVVQERKEWQEKIDRLVTALKLSADVAPLDHACRRHIYRPQSVQEAHL